MLNQKTSNTDISAKHSENAAGLSDLSFSGAAQLHSEVSSERTWGEWARGVGARLALGTAGLGVAGAVMPESQVEGGMMVSAAANPGRVTEGSSYAFTNGGFELYMLRDGVRFGGGTYIGDGKILLTNHQFAAGGTMVFGTGSDYKLDPGQQFTINQIVGLPQYDLAVAYSAELKSLRFEGVQFATSTFSGVQIGTVTSFADAYTPEGLLGADFNGPIRAGTTFLSYPNNISFLGIDPNALGRTQNDIFDPNSLGAVAGGSGQGVYLNGVFQGTTLGGIRTGPRAVGYHAAIANPGVLAAVSSVNFTAVPEPTSSALLGVAGLLAAVGSFFRKNFTYARKSQE